MISEKQFENKIKKFLTDKKVWFVKFFANRNTKSGIPDLLVCIGGRFLGIEVKSEIGQPSELQVYNVEKIREAGGLAIVLRPQDWDRFKKSIDFFTLNHSTQTYFDFWRK